MMKMVGWFVLVVMASGAHARTEGRAVVGVSRAGDVVLSVEGGLARSLFESPSIAIGQVTSETEIHHVRKVSAFTCIHSQIGNEESYSCRAVVIRGGQETHAEGRAALFTDKNGDLVFRTEYFPAAAIYDLNAGVVTAAQGELTSKQVGPFRCVRRVDPPSPFDFLYKREWKQAEACTLVIHAGITP